MPELPEVQTIVDDLNRKIKGDTIVDFWSDWPKAIKGVNLKKFEAEIKGKKILKAWRIGKNMFVDLSGGKTIYIHLKMTGHLLIRTQDTKNKIQKNKNYFNDRVNQYIHHIWKLKSGKTLEFSDLRKFAKMVLVDTDKVMELPEIKKLGVDAMSKEFTLEKFRELLQKRQNKKIGLVLMEQELIAGIGNIYRSEILFDAGMHPERSVKYLKKSEVGVLYESILKILKKAIEMRGTSDSDYRDTDGAPGSFGKILKVYRKDGKICSCVRKKKKCDTIIKRIKLGQRSVFFCSECQK
ncbi:MAG: Formamidopyrimidine-DNA glycosylase [Candidatus Moranbacteria bacterium GW2011_GWE2_35_2-]|nr:MAG: Formamidopyrimidine-DNA glycosylase [Candidatus Moranbacteria bacterium GW2011_GWE2_35_2-]KKQ06181.1 MAG: Formamidopyrimidine-DNA glycosylase [Candidatus Moranbacteria bacterium GW2011_GWF1_36_4]KKQ22274.1 MAG: Formamidopyrimidine-DNA glycosylase [Candidatus Moranbacteria bacterium GW2011_GWF2_37_11]KKQ28502.1 MAG: Formamidopyrimidine-DNA glycosylase [Candidatus Moranbacteria bacterium GW2011_GWD1_37_17]KKQ30234.1 MAG: Formamidopyrimidine-DNA glycosylase [Candidatus Moranbacteria bacter